MKCAIFCADGFEECEALLVTNLLRRANIQIDLISMNQEVEVISSHNVKILADECFMDINFNEYDVLILPGGQPGTTHLQENEKLQKVILNHHAKGKLLCAICAAPSILGFLGLLHNKKVTCFPTFRDKCTGAILSDDKVVQDGNIITGKGLGAAIEFTACIITNIQDKEAAETVLKQIQY